MLKKKFKNLFFKYYKKYFRKSVNIKQSWENTPLQYSNMVDFLNWFDSTISIENTLNKSKIDWTHRFKKFEYFQDLKKNCALEIGFGGGRLLTQSSYDFDYVYGIDIHKNFEMTEKFLNLNNIKNVTLLHRDQIPSIKDGEVDFIYSFIVFQHFDSIDEVEFYLNQISRLLSVNGVAHIYFGKCDNSDFTLTNSNEFILRDCSLFINPIYMKNQISKHFDIILFENDLPKNPLTNSGKSVQSMIVIKKRQK